eukprot:COSAG06_NODE_39597_length_410_cov_11.816720_1_plen_38_part_10
MTNRPVFFSQAAALIAQQEAAAADLDAEREQAAAAVAV